MEVLSPDMFLVVMAMVMPYVYIYTADRSIVSRFLTFWHFALWQFLAVPRLSSEGLCSALPPAKSSKNCVQEEEEEEWEPVDRDHVVKFFQVINAQSHTQMVRR